MRDLSLRSIASPAGYEAMELLYNSKQSEADRDHFALTLRRWLESRATPGDTFSVFLRGDTLQRPEIAQLLQQHAAQWAPDLGLLIRPGGEPPRMISQADLDATPWNEQPKQRHETALHLLCDSRASFAALQQLAGRGTVACCLVQGSIDAYLEQQRSVALTGITDPAFRANSFYLPWIAPEAVSSFTASQMNQCLAGTHLFLYETPGSALLLARGTNALASVESAFQDAGLLPLATGR